MICAKGSRPPEFDAYMLLSCRQRHSVSVRRQIYLPMLETLLSTLRAENLEGFLEEVNGYGQDNR